MFYVIEDGKVKHLTQDQYPEWVDFMGTSERPRIFSAKGEDSVSTVFLGVDHSDITSVSEPILFETMISYEGYLTSQRYTTWEDALKGHLKHCACVLGDSEWVTLKRDGSTTTNVLEAIGEWPLSQGINLE